MAEATLYCSFCAKSQHDVKRLIVGPNICICNECVELCNDIERSEALGFQIGPRVMLASDLGLRAVLLPIGDPA